MKMSLRLKIASKALLFVIIFGIIGYAVMYVLTPKWTGGKDKVTSTVVDFYQEPDNTIDVLFLGTSNAAHGFSPLLLWENEGIASYSLSTQVQPPLISYYFLKEALKHQDLKMVVVDVSGFYKFYNYDNERIKRYIRKTIDFLPLSSLKIQMVSEIVRDSKKSTFLNFFCPVAEYHDRWQEIKDYDFKSVVNEYSTKGADISGDIFPFEFESDYMIKRDPASGEMNDKGEDYLKRIVDICRENDITLILTSLPKSSWRIENSEALQEFCAEYNVPYIDYNQAELREAIQLNSQTDYYDGGLHLNMLGAEKVTLHLSDYLKENFNLPDHRGDDTYAEWEKDLSQFNQVFLKFKQDINSAQEETADS